MTLQTPQVSASAQVKLVSAWGAEAAEVQFILKRLSARAAHRRSKAVRRSNSKLVRQLSELEGRLGKDGGGGSESGGSEISAFQGNIQVLCLLGKRKNY